MERNIKFSWMLPWSTSDCWVTQQPKFNLLTLLWKENFFRSNVTEEKPCLHWMCSVTLDWDKFGRNIFSNLSGTIFTHLESDSLFSTSFVNESRRVLCKQIFALFICYLWKRSWLFGIHRKTFRPRITFDCGGFASAKSQWIFRINWSMPSLVALNEFV